MVTECKEVCQIFNKFFSEIGTDIGITENNEKDKHNTKQGRISTNI